nr:hypothetical protein CFP56_67781 [Quercus suber]
MAAMALVAILPAESSPDEDEIVEQSSRTDQQVNCQARTSNGCGAHVSRRGRRARIDLAKLDWRTDIVILVDNRQQ